VKVSKEQTLKTLEAGYSSFLLECLSFCPAATKNGVFIRLPATIPSGEAS
jgi:hypothetical protein